MSFDFENKVVIIINKQSKQSIFLYGTISANAPAQTISQSVSFGQQLLDQVKPSTIIVEETPLQILKQDEFTSEISGVEHVHPAINESISTLRGEQFFEFMKVSI